MANEPIYTASPPVMVDEIEECTIRDTLNRLAFSMAVAESMKIPMMKQKTVKVIKLCNLGLSGGVEY